VELKKNAVKTKLSHIIIKKSPYAQRISGKAVSLTRQYERKATAS